MATKENKSIRQKIKEVFEPIKKKLLERKGKRDSPPKPKGSQPWGTDGHPWGGPT